MHLRRFGWAALMGLSVMSGRSAWAEEPARLGIPAATPIPAFRAADPAATTQDKIQARKLTFELLVLIGPEAKKSRDAYSLFALITSQAKKGFREADEVIVAAREAGM